MSPLLHIEPPTDPQLAMIARLCAEQGWTPPGAVYSKHEASEIIGGMLAATYDAELYREPSAAPPHEHFYYEDDPFADDSDVPF